MDLLALIDFSTGPQLIFDGPYFLKAVGLILQAGVRGYSFEFDQNRGSEKAKASATQESGDSKSYVHKIEGLNFSGYSAERGQVLVNMLFSSSLAIVKSRDFSQKQPWRVFGAQTGLKLETSMVDTGIQGTDFSGLSFTLSTNESQPPATLNIPGPGSTPANLYVFNGSDFVTLGSAYPGITVTPGQFILSMDGGSSVIPGLTSLQAAYRAILGIVSQPAFTVANLAPISLTGGSSTSGNTTATITRNGNTAGIDIVTPNPGGLPAGMSISASPDPVANPGTTTVITVSITAATPTGSYSLNIQFTDYTGNIVTKVLVVNVT